MQFWGSEADFGSKCLPTLLITLSKEVSHHIIADDIGLSALGVLKEVCEHMVDIVCGFGGFNLIVSITSLLGCSRDLK